MERISFIDLGSNSVRFVISEISSAGSYSLIYQEKESIRLSENMWGENKLTEEAMSRAIRSLKAFAHMAEAMESNKTYAVATAAVRLAKNGDDFIARVRKKTGFNLHCISGEEEARLGFLGVINTVDLEDFVIFDLGGASTEVTLVNNRQPVKSVSLPIGALTLTGNFQKGDEMGEKEYEKMVNAIQDILNDNKWLHDLKLPLLGIGGTAKKKKKMDQRRINYPVTRLHNYEVPRERFHDIVEMVKDKPLAQRKKIPGLSSERADIIVAGLAIVEELINYLDADRLVVGGCGLREGLFYDYYGQEYMGGNPIINDILIHSAENVLLGINKRELIHGKYVSQLANTLFEQMEPMHGFGERFQKLLTVSALLHDIGKKVNYYNHARHGAYVLINSNLYGISHVEQALCGFIVMNSHGLLTKEYRNFIYGQLMTGEDKSVGQKLSAILALAEALDESHEQFVTSLATTIKENQIIITAWIRKDCDTSVANAAVEKAVKIFKKEFKKQLVVQWKESL